MITLKVSAAYLCPGTVESGAHITDNPRQCGCGNSNLVRLADILDREPVAEARGLFEELAALPTLRILFAEGDA